MKFRLFDTSVNNLSLKKSVVSEDSFDLQFSNGYTEENDKAFVVSFELSLKSEHGYELTVTYVGQFETDEPISDGFKNSQFPIVNAPAITYPYLRSFVSLITLNSGFEPLILPTINFQALADQQKSK